MSSSTTRIGPRRPERPETTEANARRFEELTQRIYQKAEEIRNLDQSERDEAKEEGRVSFIDSYQGANGEEIDEIYSLDYDPTDGSYSDLHYRKDSRLETEDGRTSLRRYMLDLELDSQFGLTKLNGEFVPAKRFMREKWSEIHTDPFRTEHFVTTAYTEEQGESLVDTSTSKWGAFDSDQTYIQHMGPDGEPLGSLFRLINPPVTERKS